VLKGASDKEVLKFAEENKMILVTEDKDFGKLVFLCKMPSSGIIIFRTHLLMREKDSNY